MGMPTDIPIIDTMIGFPARDLKAQYAFITQQTKDSQSKDEFEFPAEYMFKAPPDKTKEVRESEDPVAYTLEQMDKWGVAIGMVGVGHRVAKAKADIGARCKARLIFGNGGEKGKPGVTPIGRHGRQQRV